MIVQAMPRTKNEMPYGRGVLLGEEHVTTQSSVSNIGTTLFINSLATTCFWTGWRWIRTPQEEDLEARCNREDYLCKDRPHSDMQAVNLNDQTSMYHMFPNLQSVNQSSRDNINPISRPKERSMQLDNKAVATKDIQHLFFLNENR